MGASASLLTATITLESLMPARCCIAPETPNAIYSSGATILPVWPTWQKIYTRVVIALINIVSGWFSLLIYYLEATARLEREREKAFGSHCQVFHKKNKNQRVSFWML